MIASNCETIAPLREIVIWTVDGRSTEYTTTCPDPNVTDATATCKSFRRQASAGHSDNICSCVNYKNDSYLGINWVRSERYVEALGQSQHRPHISIPAVQRRH
eukprot:1656149-Rhodomonas_salina.3